MVDKKACNFTKSNTPPSVFFMFFKLYKWYQIAQNIACCKMFQLILSSSEATIYLY